MAAFDDDNPKDENVTQTPPITGEQITDFEEAKNEPEETTSKLGVKGILKAIAGAVSSGNISPGQARQIRGDLGILDSFFTKKTVSKEQRRSKRKAARKARKVTHQHGYKGQKMDKGKKR